MKTALELSDSKGPGHYSGWLVVLIVSIGIAGLASSTPFLPASLQHVVMKLFSGVCHQMPGRSPSIDGVQMAICHRCFGIYWAIPIAAVVFGLLRGRWPFRGRSAFLVLLASALPAVVDWVGDLVGLWQNTPTSRVLTGSILGLTVGYYLAKAVSDGLKTKKGELS